MLDWQKTKFQQKAAEPAAKTTLDVALEASGKIIVNFYRELGAYNKCAPTARTTDIKIVEIYSLIGTGFQQAAEQKGEHIPAEFINRIVSGFLQIYETHGESFMQEHLRYEIEKYSREGLRPDYKQPLPIFDDETEEGAIALISKGKTLAEQGQPEQAIACYDTALSLDPRLARAWFGKGEVLFHLSRHEEAKVCFGKALEIDPQCAADWAREVLEKSEGR